MCMGPRLTSARLSNRQASPVSLLPSFHQRSPTNKRPVTFFTCSQHAARVLLVRGVAAQPHDSLLPLLLQLGGCNGAHVLFSLLAVQTVVCLACAVAADGTIQRLTVQKSMASSTMHTTKFNTNWFLLMVSHRM